MLILILRKIWGNILNFPFLPLKENFNFNSILNDGSKAIFKIKVVKLIFKILNTTLWHNVIMVPMV